MGKIKSIAILLAVCLAWLGLAASQGMGASRAYDQSGHQGMGTPAYPTDPAGTVVPDYLNTYESAWQEGYQSSGSSPIRLMMEPADPAGEGLAVSENQSLSNQIYMQMGNRILTEGTAILGEEYALWARVSASGSFQLYDYSSLILSQGAVKPGWYRISGAYGSYLGGHLYRFQAAGLSSNDLTVTVSPGSYPTAFSLTGRIVDQKGQGLSGARVILTNSDGGRFSTTTDAAGYYGLDVAAGFYAVNAEHPDYAFTSSQVQASAGMVSAARPLVGTARSGIGALAPVFS